MLKTFLVFLSFWLYLYIDSDGKDPDLVLMWVKAESICKQTYRPAGSSRPHLRLEANENSVYHFTFLLPDLQPFPQKRTRVSRVRSGGWPYWISSIWYASLWIKAPRDRDIIASAVRACPHAMKAPSKPVNLAFSLA